MKRHVDVDPWKIIESIWNPENHEASESIFAIGNGKMGQRAMFEESYSGETMQGSYIAGVYYPDKTRVGWWKNGYPEYFAKVLNAPYFTGVKVIVDGEEVDLHMCKTLDFERVLDMQKALLQRSAKIELSNGCQLLIESERFFSMANDEVAVIKYNVTTLNRNATIQFIPYIDGDVQNKDSNYDEQFWDVDQTQSDEHVEALQATTKKAAFTVAVAQSASVSAESIGTTWLGGEKTLGRSFEVEAIQGQKITLLKYVGVTSSRYYKKEELLAKASLQAIKAKDKGYEKLKEEHIDIWTGIWANSDITITGDDVAQQAIRFNIFHLNQTYTGKDHRLNIGPKGFTGEKYGGSTYWDTEAYCLPFYLNTASYQVAEQLLSYRHSHLPKAIENAEKLGFINGAALYPMVTMNGEECHNEWEITFEEIHRNAAIAYAIYNYTNHSGDKNYLANKGLEVLIGIARFWAQRVNWSERKQQYVILGVTGPNEYENNINNNFYTNYMAKWCIQYTIQSKNWVKEQNAAVYQTVVNATNFNEAEETTYWQDIVNKLYLPKDSELDIYLQQDNFLDKDIIPAAQLPNSMRPINQHWSWDRILRSCYIKQADTLQAFYFFPDNFSDEELARHFDFYEPITVHESSLSPCVHTVLAAKLGRMGKAYEMYIRTARLDLDDYNNEVAEGLHITSMAGTWMAIVEGFGGLRVKDGMLHLNPQLPNNWTNYTFKINFRGRLLRVEVGKEITVERLSGKSLEINLSDEIEVI